MNIVLFDRLTGLGMQEVVVVIVVFVLVCERDV